MTLLQSFITFMWQHLLLVSISLRSYLHFQCLTLVFDVSFCTSLHYLTVRRTYRSLDQFCEPVDASSEMLRHLLYLTCNGYLVEWPEITCIYSAMYISFLFPHAQQVYTHSKYMLLHAIIDSLLNRVAISSCNCDMYICVPKMQEGLLILSNNSMSLCHDCNC